MAAIYDGSPLFGVQPNAFSKFQSASLTPIGSAKEEDYYAYLNDIFSTHWPDVLTREKDEYRSDGLEAFTWQHRPPVPRNKWTYNVGTSYSILAGDFDLVKKRCRFHNLRNSNLLLQILRMEISRYCLGSYLQNSAIWYTKVCL